MKHENKLTIGTLAKQADVSVETVRFYERKGLIKQPYRETGSYRQYSLDDIKKIKFIKRAQELGFTLKEVKELLNLSVLSKAKCGDVKKRTDLKLIEVNQKILDLRRIEKSLKKISACCANGKLIENSCPITDCFENGC